MPPSNRPLRNRVDPFGRIFATPHRGQFMGNRGRLHDAHRNVVRRWAGKCWITCALSFRDYYRPQMMRPDSYTELFFLDEPTALAAGHRPCAECRRADYNRFKALFAPTPLKAPSLKAGQIDAILHAERTARTRPRARPTDLPDGAMIALDGQPWLKRADHLHLWTPAGYTDTRPLPDTELDLLTPPSTVAVLRAGYFGDPSD